jgi:nucleotidyltransferase substrate binding protein (TIGR01987 family)
LNFADFIRTAADADLIQDVKRFLRYRQMRNMTSHTYNESKAEEIVNVLDEFVKDIHYLIKALQTRP